jgi:hypothetical protein
MTPLMTPASLGDTVLAIQTLPRRRFLQAAAAAIATFSVGMNPLMAAPAPAFKFMSADEAQVFQRLLDVMLPTQGSKLVPTSQIPVLATLDAALLATMAPHILGGLKQGLAYFNEGPRAAFGKPFVALDDADAARFCDQWADGREVPQRALAMGLKKLVALSYFANPPTWVPLGYPGPFTRRSGIPMKGNAPRPKA